jgi:hypothetical protein
VSHGQLPGTFLDVSSLNSPRRTTAGAFCGVQPVLKPLVENEEYIKYLHVLVIVCDRNAHRGTGQIMTGTATHEDSEATDRSAILLMLSYVEAECRRLGAMDAARHAALAAALVPEAALAAEPTASAADVPHPTLQQRMSRRSQLH